MERASSNVFSLEYEDSAPGAHRTSVQEKETQMFVSVKLAGFYKQLSPNLRYGPSSMATKPICSSEMKANSVKELHV